MEYGRDIIYHYTSFRGLYGILASMGIRFSTSNNANDVRERFFSPRLKFISFTHDGKVTIDGSNTPGWQNPMMWYRYAHKITGVCIGFDKYKLLELNKNIDISYSDIIYPNDSRLLTTNNDDSWKYKHISWAGEDEFRIKCNDESMFLHINIDCIERIYFRNIQREYSIKQDGTIDAPFYPEDGIIHLGFTKNKLCNIGFINGSIVELPIQIGMENKFTYPSNLKPNKTYKTIRVSQITDIVHPLEYTRNQARKYFELVQQ